MGFSKAVGIVVIFCYCLAVVVSLKQPKCRGQDVHLSEEDLKAMGDCIKEIAPAAEGETDPTKASKGIPKEKMACLGKCIMTKEGLIDDKGMPSKDNLMAKINTTMPEDVIADMDDAVAKCIDDHGSKVDPKDETCAGYQPLTQCMQVSLIQVCKAKE